MVKIIADTTSGLSPDFAKQHGVTVIPQIINIGEHSYYEGVDIDNARFMEELRNASELPKTAAPPPELFIKEFEWMVPQGEPILCIHPSAEVSGTVRAALMAAKEFPEADIRVIDTRTIGSPLASLIQLAIELSESGHSAADIEKALLELIPRSRIYFLVATLEYLTKGGRIGGASALLGSMLQIKPILVLKNGVVDQFEKERTYKRAYSRLKQIAVEKCPRNGAGYLSVMHADVPEQAQGLAEELGIEFGVPSIPILDLPPAIVTHGGPGILAVAFFTP
jgi:DegV family protein with EDD domain